jgi:NAD(P)-dependent dehydrogenase (short-subunit alcohol dehydrogenase family)
VTARRNPFDLSGKVAVVTGGSSGLGFAFADAVAAAGADVVIWARRANRNEQAAEALRAHGGRVHARSVDVSDEQAVVDGMRHAVETMGRVDCAFANAGFASFAPSFHEMTWELYDGLVSVAQHGGFYTFREAVRHMMERHAAGDPGGSLVACGSLSVTHGVPMLEHYAAAKGAMASITRSVAVEYGRYGIRANMILPGYIATGAGDGTELDPELLAYLETIPRRTPLGRWGAPEDIGGLAVYLMSDASAFHTGDLIKIDGGISVVI